MNMLERQFKLVASKSLVSTLKKAVQVKIDCTISAIFHGAVCNDVSYVKGMRRADAADFDTVLRVLIPVAWDKKHELYKFNKARIKDIASKLGFGIEEFEAFKQAYKDDKDGRDALVQDFYIRCVRYYNEFEEAKKNKDLEADLGMKALARVISGVKSALANGVDVTTLVSKIIEAGVSRQDIKTVLDPLSAKQVELEA